MKNEKTEIEKLLDAMDKFKDGDEKAFDGMTVHLDGDDPEKCLGEDK